MSYQDPAMLTNEQLVAAPANERGGMVEAYLLATIRELCPAAKDAVTASSRLADIGIDSIQVVELKFGLDQVLGDEVDIELIIGNPEIGQLAVDSVRAAGL